MNAHQEAELSVMRNIILIASFRGSEFDSVCAALLLMGLRGGEFTAASLPRELTRGDIHIAGLATKALIKMGLLAKVGYVPSPNKEAKGRPVCLLIIPDDKKPLARLWLARHGYQDHVEVQTEIAV